MNFCIRVTFLIIFKVYALVDEITYNKAFVREPIKADVKIEQTEVEPGLE